LTKAAFSGPQLFILCGVSENLSHFFVETAAMPLCPSAQPRFNAIFNVDDQLIHDHPLSLEQRLGAAALLLLGRDLGPGAIGLGFEPCDVFFELGDAHQGQVLELLRLVACNQVFFLDHCRPYFLPSAGSVHYIDNKSAR
jgi:hypothetical protein